MMGGVLLANTALRPLAYRLHPLGAEHKPDEVCYHVELTCKSQEESRVRSLLLQTVRLVVYPVLFIPCGAKIKRLVCLSTRICGSRIVMTKCWNKS